MYLDKSNRDISVQDTYVHTQVLNNSTAYCQAKSITESWVCGTSTHMGFFSSSFSGLEEKGTLALSLTALAHNKKRTHT